jgi:hypothetical protein
MREAVDDKLFLEDLNRTMDDFTHADIHRYRPLKTQPGLILSRVFVKYVYGRITKNGH